MSTPVTPVSATIAAYADFYADFAFDDDLLFIDFEAIERRVLSSLEVPPRQKTFDLEDKERTERIAFRKSVDDFQTVAIPTLS